jgi:hypothetical protein
VSRTTGVLKGAVFTSAVDRCLHHFKEICHIVLKCYKSDIGLHSLRAGAASGAEKKGLCNLPIGDYVYAEMEITYRVSIYVPTWLLSDAATRCGLQQSMHNCWDRLEVSRAR